MLFLCKSNRYFTHRGTIESCRVEGETSYLFLHRTQSFFYGWRVDRAGLNDTDVNALWAKFQP